MCKTKNFQERNNDQKKVYLSLLAALNGAVRDARKAATTFKSNANMSLKRHEAQVNEPHLRPSPR